jgi:hypothetical protein
MPSAPVMVEKIVPSDSMRCLRRRSRSSARCTSESGSQAGLTDSLAYQ